MPEARRRRVSGSIGYDVQTHDMLASTLAALAPPLINDYTRASTVSDVAHAFH